MRGAFYQASLASASLADFYHAVRMLGRVRLAHALGSRLRLLFSLEVSGRMGRAVSVVDVYEKALGRCGSHDVSFLFDPTGQLYQF